MAKKIKLQQDQVWKRGEEYLRILHLERLEVEYKSVKSLTTRAGTRHHVSKKDFCRLLKTAHLMTLEEIQRLILVGAEVTRLKLLWEYGFN